MSFKWLKLFLTNQTNLPNIAPNEGLLKLLVGEFRHVCSQQMDFPVFKFFQSANAKFVRRRRNDIAQIMEKTVSGSQVFIILGDML